jgi:selT/selW/selH-like putative selenoprotein
MRNNFLGLKTFVESKYPEFVGNVYGELYPPHPMRVAIAQMGSYVWFAGIALMFGGESIFKALGMETPDFVVQLNNNKMAAFMGLFLMNSVANSLVATGAFEIYVNDDLIFSKLQAGRFPSGDELTAAFNAMGYKAAF